MKNIKILMMSFAAVATLGLSSCVQDLETTPIDPNIELPGDVLKDEAAFEALLAKCYQGLACSSSDGANGGPDINGVDGGFGQYLSDYYVRNASFLKLDNITLSYRFNLGNACKRDLTLDLFGTVSNVATITGYKGIDPEIAGGIDNNMYPRPRTYILGLKFNF